MKDLCELKECDLNNAVFVFVLKNDRAVYLGRLGQGEKVQGD